jgi:hypothetical protein
MDREPFRPAWDEAEDEGPTSEDQLTEDGIRLRLARDLRLRGKKMPPWLWRTLKAEGRLGDTLRDPAAYRPLLERARFLLYARRVKRATRARKTPSPERQVSPVLQPEEVQRAEVLANELARLALYYGGDWDEEGTRVTAPSVVHYREAYLGGGPITEGQAEEFIDSPAVQYLSLSGFQNEAIPLVGHTARITNHRDFIENKEVWRRVDFDIEWQGGRASTWVQYGLGPAFEKVRVPRRYWPLGEKRALPYSALAELQKLGSTLAKHYLWDEGEANWFVLTGVPPRTPCFRVEREGGGRNDHTQYRLVMSIQPWVSARTVMRTYRAFQRRILRRENRQPRLDRLQLMDFVAERRHADVTWREAMIEWNRSYPKWRYRKDGVRNFQRDFEEIYHLVVSGRGKPRPAANKQA